MPSSASFENGQTIANKYMVEGVLGRGAMGIVLAARHLDLRHLVAIKILSGGLSNAATARERFLREARLAARIRSKHVCSVLDTGALEDGTPFFVMEYLDGVDLAAELKQRGRLEVSEAVGYVRQACEALSVAHASGVVHRDLKPANLFLLGHFGASRLLKVLDFGVSKALVQTGAERGSLTDTAVMVGSPLYMSPEQLDCARDVDARTDLWALGAILYELLTGEVPFDGTTLTQVVSAILQREPSSLGSHGVAVPFGLEEIMRRMLSKSPLGRYASAAELSIALAPFGQFRGESHARWSESSERERDSGDEREADPEPRSQQLLAARRRAIVTDNIKAPPKRRSRRRALLLISLVSALSLGAALLALRPSRSEHTPHIVQTQTSAASSVAADTPSVRDESPQPQPEAAGAPAATAQSIADNTERDGLQLGAADPAPAPQRAPMEQRHSEPNRSATPAVPSDPLEIPGFGGRH